MYRFKPEDFDKFFPSTKYGKIPSFKPNETIRKHIARYANSLLKKWENNSKTIQYCNKNSAFSDPDTKAVLWNPKKL